MAEPRGVSILETSEVVTGEINWTAAERAVVARFGSGAPEAALDPAFRQALRAELLAAARGGDDLRCTTVQTALGPVRVAYRGRSVLCTGVAEEADAFRRRVARDLGSVPREEEAPAAVQRAVLASVEGGEALPLTAQGASNEAVAVDLSWLPAFQRRVLTKTAEIPRGEVRPYAWIAREIGAPGATRAVGTALGRNPAPLLIPCHRVVRSDGGLGEYSGGGPAVKERILRHEQAPLETGIGPARYPADPDRREFCYASCQTARSRPAGTLTVFPSPARAVAAGYRPCPRCRPG